MAGISETDKNKEWKFLNEFWKLMKETYEPEASPDYWDGIVDRTGSLDKLFQSDLDRRLLMAYVDYLDEKWNKKQEAQDGKAQE